jgi:glycine cleavage system transcriptional repressor
MSEYAVLTAIGADRPGLVDAISGFILDRGCNIEDSRMAILGGEFAMILLLSGGADAVGRVRDGAHAAGERVGLTVHARSTRLAQAGPAAGALPYELSAYSMDHPGIVQKVAHYLAERKINIRALDTSVKAAPHSGQPLFTLEALLDIPTGTSVAEIRRGLAAIGAEENIDLELRPAAR